ncbi:hypothetical protein LSTR_LSTR014836 [Laodelphax striatellus]|uniref:Uncharacterized protein n=1 Tax=Laodelphax striatellus TaxID=195883 RepID=A0A482X098_LAOST|nr:hypothetical protein LSTR_LSTR014836 [Laodelphax striatellus]
MPKIVNTEQPIEKFCPPSANEPPERESFGRRSSTEKKRCSFQLPGIVCDLPDEECEDTQENSSSMNNNDNDCSQEMSLLQQELMNGNVCSL